MVGIWAPISLVWWWIGQDFRGADFLGWQVAILGFFVVRIWWMVAHDGGEDKGGWWWFYMVEKMKVDGGQWW